MKRVIAYVLLCLFFAGNIYAEINPADEYRSFTSKDGRSINGKLIKYDAVKGEVFFERSDAKRIWVKPAAFCGADQKYVTEWIQAAQFLSEKSLKISIEQTATHEFNQYDKVGFKLQFDNKTGTAIENVRCEIHCCIRRRNNIKTSESINWAVWERSPDVIQPGHYTWKTRELFLSSERAGTRNIQVYEIDKIEGVWIRFFGPVLDGSPVCRDVWVPGKLDDEYEWSDADEHALADYLNPYAPKKPKVTERDEGEKPGSEQEYNQWFHELAAQADYYMHKRPVELEESRKYVEKLKVLYDSKYENSTGSKAFTLGRVCYQVKDYKSAIHWYEKSITSGNPSASQERLISLYAGGMKEFENAQRAIELATSLVDADKESFYRLDLLARAYARNGQFEDAVKTQEEAIRMMKRQERLGMIDQYIRRLELYKQNMPYNDPPPDFFS